jgi:hypothetical protein
MPVATMIRPSCQQLNVATGVVRSYARCYTFLGRTNKDIFLAAHFPLIHSYPHIAHQHLSKILAMAPSGESSRRLCYLHNKLVVPLQLVSSSSFLFFSKMLSPLSRECDYLGILWFLQMTLEMMKELFGAAHVRDDEEEVPNMKRMRIGEEEVLLLQPITAAVLPEEEEVPVPQGLAVMVPPEEEGIPIPLQAPLSRSRRKKRRSHFHSPSLMWPRRNEGDALLRPMTMAPMMKALYHPC